VSRQSNASKLALPFARSRPELKAAFGTFKLQRPVVSAISSSHGLRMDVLSRQERDQKPLIGLGLLESGRLGRSGSEVSSERKWTIKVTSGYYFPSNQFLSKTLISYTAADFPGQET